MLKDYNLFSKSNNRLNESAPRIPNSEDYWIKKGKIGKVCVIYTHDDLDGIYSAIIMKNYLLNHGFKIAKYGIVNYQESWSAFKLDPQYINIALDYAEDIEGIDLYIDHHGKFQEGENTHKSSIKTATGSAYEGICRELGIPAHDIIVKTIDMVDSAKYDYYNVDIKTILNFDLKDIKNRLEFAGSFNQLLKRSDDKTFIEVIHNSNDVPSIYDVYRLFRILYPANNMDNRELSKLARQMGYYTTEGKPDTKKLVDELKRDDKKLLRTFQKDFILDAEWRLDQMQKRTRGSGVKEYIHSQKELIDKYKSGNGLKLDGYQILGQLVFVPSGTWANALRARAIIEQDILNNDTIPTIKYEVPKTSTFYKELSRSNGAVLELIGDINGITLDVKEDVTNDDKEGISGEVVVEGEEVYFKAKQPIFWLMLQYGNTLQVASYHDIKKYDINYLPKLKDGSKVTNLGKYCEDLLQNYVNHFGYNVNAIPNSKTVAGGHPGIGSVSNIFGRVRQENVKPGLESYVGSRFLDMIKNKMIQDLSGIPFPNTTMTWGDESEERASKVPEHEINKKMMNVQDIRNAQDVKAQDDKLLKDE